MSPTVVYLYFFVKRLDWTQVGVIGAFVNNGSETLLNMSVMGVVMSEGENDAGMNIDRTITSWIDQQKLNKVGS